MDEIVTERLVVRPLQAEDVPAFAAYRADPGVARYQSWDETYAPADAERLVASQSGIAFGSPGPWIQLAAVDRSTGSALRRLRPASVRRAFKGAWTTLRIYATLRRGWTAE